eukprot:scaffold28049_cov21-Phaeocystis_antarctica.AAC.1
MPRSTPPPLSGRTALFAFAAAPHLSIICCYGPAGGRERTEPEAGRQALGRPVSLMYADQRIRAPASSLLSPLVDYRLAACRWYPPCFHVRARGAQRHPLGSRQLNTNWPRRVGRHKLQGVIRYDPAQTEKRRGERKNMAVLERKDWDDS